MDVCLYISGESRPANYEEHSHKMSRIELDDVHDEASTLLEMGRMVLMFCE